MGKFWKILGIFNFLIFQTMSAEAVIVADLLGYEGETQISIDLVKGEAESFDLQITGEEGDSISIVRGYGAGMAALLSSSCAREYSESLGLTCVETIMLDSEISGDKSIRLRSDSGWVVLNLKINRVESQEALSEEDLQLNVNFIGESGPIDMGELNGPEDKIYRKFFLRNNSTVSPAGIAASVLVDPAAPFKVVSETCQGKNLRPGANCRITVEFSSSEHFNGEYDSKVQVGFPSGVVSLDVEGSIINNEQEFSKLELTLEKQLSPAQCLLETVNPSLCYYDASQNVGSQSETSGVSCNPQTNMCLVNTKINLANEPVQFEILIKFEDQSRPDPVVDTDPATISYSIDPETTTLTDVAPGEHQTVVVSVSNTGAAAIPGPLVFSLSSAQNSNLVITDSCQNLQSGLGAGESCTATVILTPTGYDSFSANLDFISVMGVDSVTISGTVLFGGNNGNVDPDPDPGPLACGDPGFISSRASICTSQDLVNFIQADASSNNGEANGTYILGADLDMAGITIGSGIADMAVEGVLNGNGFKISNAVINATAEGSGLIRNNYGEIKNLDIENSSVVVNASRVGFLAGENFGTIDNITINNLTVSVGNQAFSRDRIGGLVGMNHKDILNIDANFITITIAQNSSAQLNYVGGLVGYGRATDAAINQVQMNNLEITGAYVRYLGGIVGSTYGDLKNISVINADISTWHSPVGGIAGYVASWDGSSLPKMHFLTVDSSTILGGGAMGGIAGTINGMSVNIPGDIVVQDTDLEVHPNGLSSTFYAGGIVGVLTRGLMYEKTVTNVTITGSTTAGPLAGIFGAQGSSYEPNFITNFQIIP